MIGKPALLASLAAIGLLVPAVSAQLSFEAQPTQAIAAEGIGRLVVRDMDGVNGPDLVAGSDSFAGFTYGVFLNDGTGAFGSGFLLNVGADAPNVAAGDWDGDGPTDVIGLENWGATDRLRLLRQTSLGVWTSVEERVLTGTRNHVIASDVSGDAKVDLLLANEAGSIEVYLNDGSGTLASLVPTSYSMEGVTDFLCCDVNADGAPDLAAISEGSDRLRIRLNDGIGGFGLPLTYLLPSGTDPSRIACGDVDGNALPDLVVANRGAGTVLILRSDGAGGFLPSQFVPADPTPTHVVCGDFDCDGDVDLVVSRGAGGGSPLRGLLNDGTGTAWTETPLFDGTEGFDVSDLFAAELNGDAGLDLLKITPPFVVAGATPLFNVGAACNDCIDTPPDGVAWYAGDTCMPVDLYENHTGSIIGLPFCPIPRIGGGAIGCATGTYSRVPSDCELSPDDDDLTVDAWVRTNDAGFQPIVVMDSAPGYELSLFHGQPRVVVCDASVCFNTRGSSLINDGDWHHVAFTMVRGASTVIRIYVDGLLENTTLAPGLGTIASTNDLLLGASPSPLPSSFLDGAIDEAQIFVRALSAGEIQAIYLAGIAGQCKDDLCPPAFGCSNPEFPTPLVAGLPDDFAAPDEPATPGAILAASCAGAVDFDAVPTGGSVCHTFTGLPGTIVGGTLELRLQANGSGSACDDTISIQATGGAPAFLWSRRIAAPGGGGCAGDAGLLECEWDAPREHTLCLDLHLLPELDGSTTSVVAEMKATGRLDVRVADDTAVDFMRLELVTCACPADISGDGAVGFGDILAVLGAWGPCPEPCPPNCIADVNGNCVVDFADVLAVIGMWGPC